MVNFAEPHRTLQIPGSRATPAPREDIETGVHEPPSPDCLGVALQQGATIMTEARNVLGEPLAECCTKPMTGFYRDGSCNTGPEDFGVHTVCTRVDAAFLAFSKAAGNDLSTPVPEFGFPGLNPGDCWCLCAARWKEAFEADRAPRVRLTATHEATLEIVPLELLKRYAIDLS
jgi:uncharacterized protein (DUF2237 family)